jgi:hypothetical protein
MSIGDTGNHPQARHNGALNNTPQNAHAHATTTI